MVVPQGRIPTHVGDVLILLTAKTFSTHVVGQVSRDGQQDFDTYYRRQHLDVKYASDLAAAVAEAKALAGPGRRIFVRNIDTGEWSEISK